jgi:hypothetical protein
MRLDDDLPPVFTVTAAGGVGLTHRQTLSRDFQRPSRGVRVRADVPATLTVAVDAALAGCVPGSIVVGITAARLWGLPVPIWLERPDCPVELAVPPGEAHARRAGVRGRRLDVPEEHSCELEGRPVTTVARTWVDCAADLKLPHLVAMGDVILARGLATADEIWGVLHWAYRRRGVATARAAWPLLDGRSQSPGESMLRVGLVGERLPRPVCNLDVVEFGEWLARVDIAWPEWRVAVEYDGAVHLTEEARRKDARRRNLLLEHGWLVITATADDLRRPWVIAAQVRAALLSRGWTPAR